MKIAITADIHVGVPGRLNDIIWSLCRIREYCAEHSIGHIFILGDLLHDREQLRIDDLNALVSFLSETDEKYGIKIIAFPGNHDMYLKNSWDINSLKPLERYLEAYYQIDKFVLGGVRFWIVPFIHYESRYTAVLNAINKKHKDGDVLLTHIGVRSSTLNMCFLLKSWSIIDFADSPFDRVYTGHFHIKQKVGKNVWYPGSPIPFKFDEGDIDHGFLIFDTESRTHEFVDLWDGVHGYAPPKFITIADDDIRSADSIDVKGNIIRVALSRDWTHNQLADIRECYQKLGAIDVRWLNLRSKEEKESVAIAQEAAASASDLFKRFVEADKRGTKNLDVKTLLKLNTEIVADGDRKYSEC